MHQQLVAVELGPVPIDRRSTLDSMDEIDNLFATVLVSMADDGKTESPTKSSFPDYPEENPTKSAAIRWLDTWEDDLNSSGYAAIMRGELPHDVARLTDRELLDVPAAASDAATVSRRTAIESENARIEFTNKQNKAERIAKVTELKNRVAAKLKKAMRFTAPIKLQELMETLHSHL